MFVSLDQKRWADGRAKKKKKEALTCDVVDAVVDNDVDAVLLVLVLGYLGGGEGLGHDGWFLVDCEFDVKCIAEVICYYARIKLGKI